MLVVTDAKPTVDDLQQILLPWHEYECTGYDKYIVDTDETDTYLTQYKEHCAESAKEGKVGRLANGYPTFREYLATEEYCKHFISEGDPVPEGSFCYARCDKDGQVLRYFTRTNPNAKWDWWVLGGRWDNEIPNNQIRWGDLDKKALEEKPIRFFGWVKDDQWVERGNMGWWGMVANETEETEWNQQKQGFFDSLLPDQWLSIVDCHI